MIKISFSHCSLSVSVFNSDSKMTTTFHIVLFCRSVASISQPEVLVGEWRRTCKMFLKMISNSNDDVNTLMDFS